MTRDPTARVMTPEEERVIEAAMERAYHQGFSDAGVGRFDYSEDGWKAFLAALDRRQQ